LAGVFIFDGQGTQEKEKPDRANRIDLADMGRSVLRPYTT
jgi:hypothetical protein